MAGITNAQIMSELKSIKADLDKVLEKVPSEPVPYNQKAIEALLKACFNGTKIEAIKEVRAICGIGLKESKDLVEKHWRYYPTTPNQE